MCKGWHPEQKYDASDHPGCASLCSVSSQVDTHESAAHVAAAPYTGNGKDALLLKNKLTNTEHGTLKEVLELITR